MSFLLRAWKDGTDHPCLIDDDGGRDWNARVNPFFFGIKNSVRANGFTFLIRKQRKRNVIFSCKIAKDTHIVIANSNDLNFSGFNIDQLVLQFDQLRFAKNSPIGGAKENDRRKPFFLDNS